MKATGRRFERGFAVLEVAAWAAVFLPIMLLLIDLMVAAQDARTVKFLPGTVIRELSGRAIFWRGAGVTVNRIALEEKIDDLRDRAWEEAQQQTRHLQNVAARACYWVFAVNSGSGAIVGTPLMTNCLERNPDNVDVLGRADIFTQPLIDYLGVAGRPSPRAIPVGNTSFLPLLVVFGLAVGGNFDGISGELLDNGVRHAELWVPREGVTL
jgi:hypothetical protein